MSYPPWVTIYIGTSLNEHPSITDTSIIISGSQIVFPLTSIQPLHNGHPGSKLSALEGFHCSCVYYIISGRQRKRFYWLVMAQRPAVVHCSPLLLISVLCPLHVCVLCAPYSLVYDPLPVSAQTLPKPKVFLFNIVTYSLAVCLLEGYAMPMSLADSHCFHLPVYIHYNRSPDNFFLPQMSLP